MNFPKWTVLYNIVTPGSPWVGTGWQFFNDKEEAKSCFEQQRAEGNCPTLRPFNDQDKPHLGAIHSVSTDDLIDAAEKQAAFYDEDDRPCIKTDVINSFYAGAMFFALLPHKSRPGTTPATVADLPAWLKSLGVALTDPQCHVIRMWNLYMASSGHISATPQTALPTLQHTVKSVFDQITADANEILRLLNIVDKNMGGASGATESIDEHAHHILKTLASLTKAVQHTPEPALPNVDDGQGV